MKKIFSVVFLSSLSIHGLLAQELAVQRMNLETCMAYAVDNSYKSARAANDAANSRLNFTGAILNHLPSISGNVNAGSNFGRGVDPQTNTYINTATFSNGISASAGITIFDGLRLLNQTRSAKIAKLRGEEQLRQTRDEVAELTMVAYAEVVYNTELLELNEQLVTQYKASERLALRKSELGTGSDADLAQIRATLSSQEYTVISVKNQLENSIIQLKDCMNFPLDDSLIIEPRIEQAEVYRPEQDVQQIFSYATVYNPKAVVNKQLLSENKLSLSIARGNYYPGISASGSISTGYNIRLDGVNSGASPYGVQLKNNLGEGVGISMSVPIFNGLSTRFAVARARNNYNQAKRDYSESMRTLDSEIRQSVMDLDAAQSQWNQARKNVEYQRIANEANTRKYQEGLLGIIELQTSDNQLLKSEIELRNSYLRYQIKIREVNYYKGIPYIF